MYIESQNIVALMIDREEVDPSPLVQGLEGLGIKVVRAQQLEEAAGALLVKPFPNIILLNPYNSGISIRSLWEMEMYDPLTPIMVLGRTFPDAQQDIVEEIKILRQKADHFVKKPITPEKLAAHMRAVLRRI